ncbi:hypothetical protein ACOMHN_010422 [Nucella lapillus]
MKMLQLLPLLGLGILAGLDLVRAYPNGPPMGACGHMFPTGHGNDAMTSDPPYSLVVTGGPLTMTGQTFNLTLRVKGGTEYKYFKGWFVQARMASCYMPEKPLGSFILPPGDTYSQLMNCHKERPNSALAHNKSMHVNDKLTFQWQAPNSLPGHFYFRATVVKNKSTFWTNVFSEIIKDESDQYFPVPTKYCDVCMKKAACTASSFAALTSLIVAALGVSLFWP